MSISQIKLVNFRCFNEISFDIKENIVSLWGQNGSGKSSVIEALYYGCYLRSFRTRIPNELISFDKEHLFISITLDNGDSIGIGYSSQEGKLAKYNQKIVSNYRDIIDHYRIVCMIQDDLTLVQGAPEYRRDFLNYALFLKDPSCVSLFRNYNQVLEQRNNLLKNEKEQGSYTFKEQLYVWTEKLWVLSCEIKKLREGYLETLNFKVNDLLEKYFKQDSLLKIDISYKAGDYSQFDSFDSFWGYYENNLYQQECNLKRGVFGAHKDDFIILFKDKRARLYASRGQQKFIVFLLKIAQLVLLNSCENSILLLDDFLTDFDEKNSAKALEILKDLSYQIFLTTPSFRLPILEGKYKIQAISL